MQIFAEITPDAVELTAGVYTLRKWDRISTEVQILSHATKRPHKGLITPVTFLSASVIGQEMER